MNGYEMVEHYTNGKIVKSVRFRAYRGDTVASATDRLFSEAQATIHIAYAVTNGQVVQGTPNRLTYFQTLFSGSNSTLRGSSLDAQAGDVRTMDITDNIGRVVMPATETAGKLTLFWNNGAKWVKVGGEVDATNQMVTYQTARLGSYQLRQAALLGDTSLLQVYPRIFTPNGDGANDVVIFQYGEGALASGSLTGEIYDLSSAKVATLQPGPDPLTTMQWDGKDEGGKVVPAGIYIYQLKVGGTTVNGTVVVAK